MMEDTGNYLFSKHGCIIMKLNKIKTLSSAGEWLCADPRNYCSLTYTEKDLGSVLD